MWTTETHFQCLCFRDPKMLSMNSQNGKVFLFSSGKGVMYTHKKHALSYTTSFPFRLLAFYYNVACRTCQVYVNRWKEAEICSEMRICPVDAQFIVHKIFFQSNKTIISQILTNVTLISYITCKPLRPSRSNVAPSKWSDYSHA